MKYKTTGILLACLMIVCALAASAAEQNSGTNRYHQHRDAPVPSEPCTCSGTELCTHLPILRIDTGGQEIPGNPITGGPGNHVVGYTTTQSGESEILVTLETVEAEGAWHHASDPASQSAAALFRIRGNSSRFFTKKNYRIKLVDSESTSESLDLPLLGMNPDNDWALHGPFLDKTLIRNYMWMNLSAEIMGYAPNVRFCEVILDGEYMGVYVLMETIKESEYRVDLTDYEPGSAVGSYLLRLDIAKDEGLSGSHNPALYNYTWYTHQTEFSEIRRTGFQVLYPNAAVITSEVTDFIQRDISQIERGLYSSDMVQGRYDYASAIDVDSFVDYYILQEFLANNDAFARSTYFYRDIRGKLHIGPVWDYNNVLNNFFQTLSRRGFLLANRGWYGRLMTDERFVTQVITRYRQLRSGILSDESLVQYIDDVIAYLGPAIERNDSVWGYSYDASLLHPEERRIPDEVETLEEVNPSSYEEAVGWMEGYMLARGAWMDEHIEDLLQYCHPSKTASQRVE